MSHDSHLLPPDPATDLVIASAMVEELENYIVNDDLYRTVIVRVPGRGDLKLQLAGGSLLTRLHRLDAQRDRLTPAQQDQLDRTVAQAERIIYSLKSRFHQRLQREMKGRLDALKWYLDDIADDPGRGRANYPYEIRNRQRIEEIVKRLGSDIPADLADRLAAVDRRLHALAGGSDFVWDPSLRSAFPSPPYWYLYARV